MLVIKCQECHRDDIYKDLPLGERLVRLALDPVVESCPNCKIYATLDQ